MPAPLSLSRQVKELTLIRCSILPGEHLTFLSASSDLRLRSLTTGSSSILDNDPSTSASFEQSEAEKWERLVLSNSVLDFQLNDITLSPARFQLAADGAKVSFEIDCQGYDGECRSVNDCITISGDNLSRSMQEWWREKIKEGLDRIGLEEGSEYPLYQLLTLYLLPLLHQTIGEEPRETQSQPSRSPRQVQSQTVEDVYHALFTSHHLVSSTKRRNLQRWSSELRIDGFAKVGYPGVIYAQGSKDDIEEFAGNVKVMQWRALKARFVEHLESPSRGETCGRCESLSGWNELEKVGQVVEVMRRMGRGKYVTEMGIGGGDD